MAADGGPGTGRLRVRAGQCSDRGRKATNQDFHGLWTPDDRALATRGVAVALADGISSSNVSQVAAEAAVTGFLNDYYSTPDTWSVKHAAHRVLSATNAWLHAQTRQSQYRYDLDRGYVCTLAVLILHSTTAHVFHAGDTRVYRLRGDRLECLTDDHRLWLSRTESCLTRAMGLEHRIELDYHSVPVTVGDRFLLATDGVYEFLDDAALRHTLTSGDDLDATARALVDQALAACSDDNLTVQVLEVSDLPDTQAANELEQALEALPLPPELAPGQRLDGYRILDTLHASSRSQVLLAVDEATDSRVALKLPSREQRDDPAYLARFAAEAWIGQRLHSPHVVRPFAPERARSCLYLATHYVAGESLRQWMLDRPKPALAEVRALVAQVVKGLRAFHRLEMAHLDMRPDNVRLDAAGTAQLIDFGATRVAGLPAFDAQNEDAVPRGAALYCAPEILLGEPGDWRSDQFSLGVMTYQMLTGALPYDTDVPGIRQRSDLRRLHYRPARDRRPDLPPWLDDALARAVHPEPHKRYPALSEFVQGLHQPDPDWHRRHRPPLMARHPVVFWQGVSAALLLALLASLALGR
ncbi:bifunctional protein-serine/threonine kinase/phosphatase [Marinobacter sp. C2H3]|uniref:bifunctional protein-serine/threonine kinase/phosphatase n=1 Tax=Marinobacter sp. C2H3 TaxID=3119003 RepID=UPI00300F633C